jgi:hypothetical protein
VRVSPLWHGPSYKYDPAYHLGPGQSNWDHEINRGPLLKIFSGIVTTIDWTIRISFICNPRYQLSLSVGRTELHNVVGGWFFFYWTIKSGHCRFFNVSTRPFSQRPRTQLRRNVKCTHGPRSDRYR